MSALSRCALRALLPVVLGLFVSACGSTSSNDVRGQILVVDARGVPIRNAVVLPDPEYPPAEPPRYSQSDLQERATNAQGLVLVFLDDFYWKSDGCYHFRVHQALYEDETMSVSRDLFPAVLKIDLRPKVPATLPTPGGRPN
jgi:hypothetical protein